MNNTCNIVVFGLYNFSSFFCVCVVLIISCGIDEQLVRLRFPLSHYNG